MLLLKAYIFCTEEATQLKFFASSCRNIWAQYIQTWKQNWCLCIKTVWPNSTTYTHINTHQGSSCNLQLWCLAPIHPQTCSSPTSFSVTWALPPQTGSLDSSCRSQDVRSVSWSPGMISRTHHHHQMLGQSPLSPRLEWIATPGIWRIWTVHKNFLDTLMIQPN